MTEPLEPRAMMDGSGLVRYPYWNILQPRDVNADGQVSAMDALSIVNELNLRGARELGTGGAATGSGGEDGSSSTQYIDVNNDNRLSAMDALMVINALNSAGEGNPQLRYTVQIVQAGTNDDLTTINKGGFYEMRVLVTDLGELSYMTQTRPATLPLDHPTNPGETALGVYTTFFDVTYNTTATDVQVNESQNITFTGTPVTGQTFTLTVNDGGTLKTTGNITVGANTASGRNQTNTNIKNALNTLLGAGTVDVSNPITSQNQWRVRFLNRLSNQDVPEMTATPSGMFGATIAVTELVKGLPSNPAAYSDALLPRTVLDGTNFPINDPLYYTAQRQGSRMATGIDDVGGTMATTSPPFPGVDPMEILRVRMNALDAGVVNFNVSIADVISGLETGLLGFTIPVTADLIQVVPDTLTITEPLSAGDDSANTTEGSVTPITINVLANDTNNPPPQLTKTIQSIDLTGTLGTAVINGSQIVYTPPGGDINGVDTFKYTVSDTAGNSDTATVTINIAAVNDAPVVNGPASQTFNEDIARVFSTANGNAITVTDVDAASGQMTMTLSVGAGNGTLSVANIPGAPGGVTNNNSSSVTVNGTLTELNSALQNLTYTPVLNASGTVNLTVTVNDNGNTPTPAMQGNRVIALNITATNDAPVVELGGFTATPTVVEGDPLVLNSASNTLIQVSDVDAGANPVVVTLNVSAGNTITVPTTAGVTIGTNGTNNVTLTGTVANINTALSSITYQAAIGFGGTNENLQITVNDQGNTGAGGPLSDIESKTIVVDPAVRPAARVDTLTVDEDSIAGIANTVDVLFNDLVNLPGAPTVLPRLISFQMTTANGGTITLDDNMTPGVDTDDKLIYVPAPNYFGTDSFTYVMNDTTGMGANSTGTVNVTVRGINDTPTAMDDMLASNAEDSGPWTILAATLTGNDSAGPLESSQTLTIISAGSAVGGTVAVVSGNVVFTPTGDYNGPASFTYTIQDNGTTFGVADPLTATATATFTITEVNDVPTANNQSLATIAEDTPSVTIPFATLLTGATTGPANENGQTLTISAVTSPVGGTVAIMGTDVIFTPTANFNGSASFSFTVTDNGTTNGASDPKSVSATASFTITPVNDAPTAVNDTATTGESQPMAITVRVNDFDVDVSPFTGTPGALEAGTTIVNISTPTDGMTTVGTAVVQGSGILFTPNAGFFGTATFTYQLNDGSGAANNLSNTATVTVTVVERNDPPVANNDTATTPEDPATPLAIDILANDTDPDTAKSNWSVTIVTPPQHGTAVFNPTTRVIDYTPALNYNGPDSFVYKVNDQSPIAPVNLDSGNATVSITVTEVNDPPVATNDPVGPAFIVIKDRDRTFTAASLTANDSPGIPANESGQTITITSVSYTNPVGFSGGSVTLSAGVITYTAPAGYVGPDSFTYTITDNGTTAGAADPKTATATVSLNVVDFIPTNVQGYAYIDANNNGVFDPNERPLGGVDITLAGTSDITGVITPITMTTNIDGFYLFAGVQPGTYTLTEQAPLALRDGKDTAGVAASLSGTNDVINLTLPLLGVTGGISNNYFGELGVDAGQLADSQGLIGELLASSTATGFVLAATMSGDMFWSWALNGWGGCDDIAIDLDTDLSAATLTATHNGTTYTTRIFQNPYDTRNANRTNPDSLARLARFRILGRDASNNYIIRLDGTAEHFYGVGSPLAFAPVMSGGEDLSAGEYVDGVDAAMAEESWA